MNGKYVKWTSEMDARLISLWKGGATCKEIVKELDVTPDSVYQRVARMKKEGIIANERRRRIDPYRGTRTIWTTKMESGLIRMKGEGLKNHEIASRFRCSIRAVEQKISRLRGEGRMPEMVVRG